MLAHIRKEDGKIQNLENHCHSVSTLCVRAASNLGLNNMAGLLGLLHDMGKGTATFEMHLHSCVKGEFVPSHNHAPTGAIFVFQRWFLNGNNTQRLTAQILAMCIYGHHTGLMNCLNDKGDSDFLNCMQQDTASLKYEEATRWFLSNVANISELDERFMKACREVFSFWRNHIYGEKQEAFYKGMLARLLLSILVDADRWDAACFDRGYDSLSEESLPRWDELLATFETYLSSNLNAVSPINKIRAEISESCYENASLPSGVFTLCVPTGGGKTYSSLRFALRHAALHGHRRIFYVIPYNTILDQNARDIRSALSPFDSILEHHSNVVLETAAEQENYRLLTERWDSSVILTSLLQFLNAFYASSNTDARRLYRLTDSVLIFDEVQSLPKHCKTLFEWAIQFLARCCHCTVVLCTATQPKLDLCPAPVELMENTEVLFESMRRVEYLPQLKAMSNAQATRNLCDMVLNTSVLAIVNTKATAKDIFENTVDLLRESGLIIAEAEFVDSDEEINREAQDSGEREILCVHLSTLLCPAHRLQMIRRMKQWLKAGRRVFCVSTALIEAGINISFPVVVRSLAGLPSVVQAAGRANRNMEYEKGRVHLWILSEENLKYLPDIQHGQNISRTILSQRGEKNLDMPCKIETYFTAEYNYTKKHQDYPSKKHKGTTLADMLSENAESVRLASKESKNLALKQSFRNAYEEFEVIPDKTVSILVPYGEGAKLIAQLNGKHTMEEERFLLREAQAYSVAVYEDTIYKTLLNENALYPVGECGVWALEEGYYDNQMGVSVRKGKLSLDFN